MLIDLYSITLLKLKRCYFCVVDTSGTVRSHVDLTSLPEFGGTHSLEDNSGSHVLISGTSGSLVGISSEEAFSLFVCLFVCRRLVITSYDL